MLLDVSPHWQMSWLYLMRIPCTCQLLIRPSYQYLSRCTLCVVYPTRSNAPDDRPTFAKPLTSAESRHLTIVSHNACHRNRCFGPPRSVYERLSRVRNAHERHPRTHERHVEERTRRSASIARSRVRKSFISLANGPRSTRATDSRRKGVVVSDG